MSSVLLKYRSQPQGTGTDRNLPSCLNAAGQLHTGTAWVSIGLDWASLDFPPLGRT